MKHNLARLRESVLKLRQQEMAELAGCSRDTIQSVELGRLKLSEELARKLSAATGVHFRWLIENDLQAEIITATGAPYSRSHYELCQAQKKVGRSEFVQFLIDDYAVSFYGQMRAALSSAVKRDLAEVAVWKMAKFLEDCRDQFGHDRKLLPNEKQFGLREDDSPYLKHSQVEAGLALFRAYDKARASEALKPRPQNKRAAARPARPARPARKRIT